MGTKNNPGAFDCYANAEPDEPMFVLLARDEKAPAIVRAWVHLHRLKRIGKATAAMTTDELKYNDKEKEAIACADAMEKWRKERDGKSE
jgi:hypothetical protein